MRSGEELALNAVSFGIAPGMAIVLVILRSMLG
jgi:hypothetical protein